MMEEIYKKFVIFKNITDYIIQLSEKDIEKWETVDCKVWTDIITCCSYTDVNYYKEETERVIRLFKEDKEAQEDYILLHSDLDLYKLLKRTEWNSQVHILYSLHNLERYYSYNL